MKTPREVLLARHQAAAPKLDAIRRSVVTGLNHQGTKEQSFSAYFVSSFLGGLDKFWLELIWPCRRVWSGLATVWVLLLIINVAQRDTSSMSMTKSAQTTAMITTFRDQQKLLNELFADRTVPVEAEPRRIYSPKPRTETLQMLTA